MTAEEYKRCHIAADIGIGEKAADNPVFSCPPANEFLLVLQPQNM